MKCDLVVVFHNFFENFIIRCTNELYICLIPKRNNVTKVKGFRPISLITSLYKIIAKVLAGNHSKNWLKMIWKVPNPKMET